MDKKLFKGSHWFALAVSLVVFLFCAIQVSAQNYQGYMTLEQKVKNQTDNLKNDVKLTDRQYQESYDIFLKYTKDEKDIQNRGKSRKAANRAIKSSEKEKTQEFKLVLDENQFKEYKKIVKAQEERNQIAEDAIVAKEKAAKAELKSKKADEKAEKANEKAEKAREKSDKAVKKANDVKRYY